MYIIVDAVPEKPDDCHFAEYDGDGLHKCKLDDYSCPLSYNNSCDKLIELGSCNEIRRR